MKKAFNTIEVAKLLGISYRTVRKYISNGTIRAKKLEGTRRWIVMEDEILRLQGEKSSNEDPESR